MENLSFPYAKAIFQIAVEKGKIAEWTEMLERFEKLEPQFWQMLKNPTLDNLPELILAKISPITRSLQKPLKALLQTLEYYGRLQILPALASSFRRLQEAQDKTDRVQIISAFSLTEEEVEQFKNNLVMKLGHKVIVDGVKVNPNLIGGVQIVFQDGRFLDMSFKGKLEQFATQLTS